MEIGDIDSGVELPNLQKKARADSGDSLDEEYYQWDDIPPPTRSDKRLTSRFLWGDGPMVLGKPFSDFDPEGGRTSWESR